jgi:hypothetical protein
MSISAGQIGNIATRPQPSLGAPWTEIMQKLEEINCLLAAVDVIAKAAYEQGVEAGRASTRRRD